MYTPIGMERPTGSHANNHIYSGWARRRFVAGAPMINWIETRCGGLFLRETAASLLVDQAYCGLAAAEVNHLIWCEVKEKNGGT